MILIHLILILLWSFGNFINFFVFEKKAMELKKMKQRLENIIQLRTESSTLNKSAEGSLINHSNRDSPRKVLSPVQIKNATNIKTNKSTKLFLNN
jgi:hypothetical protein